MAMAEAEVLLAAIPPRAPQEARALSRKAALWTGEELLAAAERGRGRPSLARGTAGARRGTAARGADVDFCNAGASLTDS